MNRKSKLMELVLIVWGLLYQCSGQNPGEQTEGYPDLEGEGGAQEPNWCDLKCENGEDNALCLEVTSNAYISNCYNFSLETTPEQRSEILHWHNELRNKVVWGYTGLPMATNMRQLEWNEDLEFSANIWVLTCTVGLAKCRRTMEFTDVGQNFNLVGTKSKQEDAPGYMSCLIPWASEENRATNETIAHYSLKGDGKWTANFVNLIAAETYSVGCATAAYQQGGYHFRSVVCNYGPGLKEGWPVYEDGWPCEGCPYNWTCRNESLYPYLCSLSGQPLGKSGPIETLAAERTDDLFLTSGVTLLFTAWSIVWETFGSICAYFLNKSGHNISLTNHI